MLIFGAVLLSRTFITFITLLLELSLHFSLSLVKGDFPSFYFSVAEQQQKSQITGNNLLNEREAFLFLDLLTFFPTAGRRIGFL